MDRNSCPSQIQIRLKPVKPLPWPQGDSSHSSMNLTVQGHNLWYLKSFSFPQVMLTTSHVAVFLFWIHFFSKTVFWQEPGSSNGHHSNRAAWSWMGRKTTYAQRFPPRIQRKAKALTGTTQRLCLDFCPGSVGRFMRNLAYQSTQMQTVSSQDKAWRWFCPAAQLQTHTQRTDIRFQKSQFMKVNRLQRSEEKVDHGLAWFCFLNLYHLHWIHPTNLAFIASHWGESLGQIN